MQGNFTKWYSSVNGSDCGVIKYKSALQTYWKSTSFTKTCGNVVVIKILFNLRIHMCNPVSRQTVSMSHFTPPKCEKTHAEAAVTAEKHLNRHY